jgi:hypothetical protein
MTHLLRSSNFWLLRRAVLVVISLTFADGVLAQTAKKVPAAGGDEAPVFNDYRGVKLGWIADEVRKKLGNPANKADDQDFYMFGENERAQVYYDKDRQVTAISIDFMNGATGAFTPEQVLGSGIEAKSDGSMTKLVRYPKAGYWVSYSRTAGEKPMISVTIQKMVQ